MKLNTLQNVTLYNAAIADRTGTMELFIPRITPENSGTASLIAMQNAEKVKVPTMMLSSIVADTVRDKIDLMKIDVEGAETIVLRSSLDVIEQHRPIIIYEYDTSSWRRSGAKLADVKTMLAPLGYRQFRIPFSRFYPTSLRLKELGDEDSDGNIVAVPAERLDLISGLIDSSVRSLHT